jgi:hypothetical protein
LAGEAPLRMGWKATIIAVCLAGVAVSCSQSRDRQPALGEAYAGPLALPVREALAARAETVDTLHHGDRVELLARRRGFYRIRTERGREGWVDGKHLLSAAQMEDLRKLAERAAASPAQGTATVPDALNLHTVPHRQAPSFRQIRPQEPVAVIAYARVERRPYQAAPLLAGKTGPAASGTARKKKQKIQAEPLAKPAVPGLPPNWLELSRPQRPEETPPAQAAPPAPKDEWALVRCKDGAAGWVLARMLFMAIPDDVAQYAERARIAAFFSIGSTKAKDGEKPVWLWAAQSQRDAAHDFDSLRIFVWSAKRNRWETSFIERGLKGYLPIELLKPDGKVTGFEAVFEEKDGRTRKRRYDLLAGTYRARVASREEAPPPQSWLAPQEEKDSDADTADAPQSWTARLGGWLEGLRTRFSR